MWALLQNLLIGLLAPGGIWFGWYLQRRDKAADKERECTELLRTKAEAIYEEIEVVRAAASQAVMSAIEYAHRPDAQLQDMTPSLARLNALIHMNFPAGASILGAHAIKAIDPINQLTDKMQAINGDAALSVGEKSQQLKNARVVYAQAWVGIAIETLGNLESFMNKEVKRLVPGAQPEKLPPIPAPVLAAAPAV